MCSIKTCCKNMLLNSQCKLRIRPHLPVSAPLSQLCLVIVDILQSAWKGTWHVISQLTNKLPVIPVLAPVCFFQIPAPVVQSQKHLGFTGAMSEPWLLLTPFSSLFSHRSHRMDHTQLGPSPVAFLSTVFTAANSFPATGPLPSHIIRQ